MKCQERKSGAKMKACLSRCCNACITKRKTPEKRKICLEIRRCPTDPSWIAGFAGAGWNERKGKEKKLEDDVENWNEMTLIQRLKYIKKNENKKMENCPRKCMKMVKPMTSDASEDDKIYGQCLKSCCDTCKSLGYTKENVEKCQLMKRCGIRFGGW